ncbi:related to 6-hydroxy-d-nicotine oxidase [Cephalotrichum gorgonifer]|uniref:Related to 6-hydroxy-d-nicotine oxidase n=1 Tax=Cephalotrichum gorgonifer TaxID=2041049 RepID=A0AAE8ST05_9PEZI|nr:related to 6-hydroxy-d-nicotine oxidase [Cephalotrichum gorgonifer]
MRVPNSCLPAAALLWLAGSVFSVSAERPNVCAALNKALPGAVAFPPSEDYATSNTYWSERQSEARPLCFVTPKSTADVSKALKLIMRHRAPFAVKSGGHTAFRGASNVDGGVTIDLRGLNRISVSRDRKTVSVGPANRWIEVSTVLDPLRLAAVGGRAADVGVGGLTLGGGISYFSGRHGWACDNVRAFEIVLASGKVVTATASSHADLYRALRGGGGASFGVVTRLDLAVVEQGDLWTQSAVYPGAMNATLVPLFVDLALSGLPADPDAHTYFVMTNRPDLGGVIALTSFYHAVPPSPSSPEDVPATFEPFQDVPNAVFATSAISNVSTLARGIDQAYGQRQTWWDTTVRIASPDLFLGIVHLFEAHVARLAAASTPESPVSPFLVFQPVTTNIIEAMQKDGGNALGLDPAEGPLMIVQVNASWEDAALDELVEQSSGELVEAVNELARRSGLDKGLVYMNYGGKGQDVLRSYGPESYRRLKKVAAKYDPKGILGDLWTGYFHV